MGAHVIVAEVDPLRALEAVMDGFRVLPVAEAAPIGDVFVTATGDKHVLRREHFEVMKDGAILANTGHFNVEIDIPALRELATEARDAARVRRAVRARRRTPRQPARRRAPREPRGRRGPPAAVMDMSFANQALSAEYAVKHGGGLEHRVYVVPAEIDREIARLKLASMGVAIDTLTDDQAQLPRVVGPGHLTARGR